MKAWSFLLFSTLLTPALAGEPLKVPGFEAHYILEAGGGPVAKATFTLIRDGDRITYRYETRASGLFSLFYKDEVTEQSIMEISGNTLRPLEYTYRHKGSKKNRDVTTHFDWDTHRAHGEARGEPFDIEIPDGVMDRFSAQLLVSQHLHDGTSLKDFPFVDKNELDTYEFERLGEETLETELGEFKTIKLKRAKGNKKRTTIGWYAPELNYLPVQLEQSKKGSSRKIVMKIDSITWH